MSLVGGHWKSGYVVISFDRVIYKLLKCPYESQCIDYDTLGYKSQSEAINHCLNQLSIRRLGAIDKTLADVSTQYPVYSKWKGKKLTDLRDQMFQECNAKYPSPDCEKVQYIPKVAGFSSTKSNSTNVILLMNFKEDMVITAKPQYTLLQYLIYLGSTLSFWFGTTFMSLGYNLKVLAVSMKSMIRKYKFRFSKNVNKISVSFNLYDNRTMENVSSGMTSLRSPTSRSRFRRDVSVKPMLLRHDSIPLAVYVPPIRNLKT